MDKETILNTEVKHLTAHEILTARRAIDEKLNNSRYRNDKFLLSRQARLLQEQKARGIK